MADARLTLLAAAVVTCACRGALTSSATPTAGSSDPTYRGRWLVERRDEQRLGVSAVAPFETTGYASPDWHGFVGDGLLRPIPRPPGLWAGIDYDFVTSEGDSGVPGLADEVAGCLGGT